LAIFCLSKFFKIKKCDEGYNTFFVKLQLFGDDTHKKMGIVINIMCDV